ncbi:MAG: mechanosensitive ion channel domain-containing protein [Actinomycetota bacterium]
MLQKLNPRLRVRAIILTGVVCISVVRTIPAIAQGLPQAEDAKVEKVEDKKGEDAKPEKPPNPEAATTTKDVNIPVDELKLLVKPLTLEDLRNEAAAWMLTLQKKAKEISEAEVTIKRQNQTISHQKEGAEALEKAKQALEEAEKAQKGATPGSLPYQEATKKVEEAKEHFKKAQESVEKAKETKKDLKQDDTANAALKKAEKTGILETAKQTLDQIKADRDQTTAGTLAYEDTTKTIEKLETAIQAFEKAQKAQKATKPNSPDSQVAIQNVEKTYEDLKQVLQEIRGTNEPQSSSEQSSHILNQATSALKNTEIKNNSDQKVAGSPGVVNNQQNLQQNQQQLKHTTEQLQKSADTESKVKNQLVVTVTELQSQLTAIVDRSNTILDELEKKGGNVKPYRQYIQAVTALEVDTKDTEGLGLRLLSWAKSSEGGMRWAGNLGKFTGIIIASIIISQILGTILGRLLSLFRISAMLRQFIVMLVKRGGIVIGFLLALTALELSLGPVLALLGGVSFILAFALQSNLGNLASGLMIMAYKPFDVGDEIKIEDIWGWVRTINLASTVIEGANGEMYNIPNNMVWDSTIENLTPDEIRQIQISLRIGFDEDLPKVEQLLVDVFRSHPVILEKPSPSSRVEAIEEYYILASVRGWIKTEPPLKKVLEIRSELIRMIREKFNAAGIKLAAIPTGIEIGIEAPSNGKVFSLMFDNPTEQVEAIEAKAAKV